MAFVFFRVKKKKKKRRNTNKQKNPTHTHTHPLIKEKRKAGYFVVAADGASRSENWKSRKMTSMLQRGITWLFLLVLCPLATAESSAAASPAAAAASAVLPFNKKQDLSTFFKDLGKSEEFKKSWQRSPFILREAIADANGIFNLKSLYDACPTFCSGQYTYQDGKGEAATWTFKNLNPEQLAGQPLKPEHITEALQRCVCPRGSTSANPLQPTSHQAAKG